MSINLRNTKKWLILLLLALILFIICYFQSFSELFQENSDQATTWIDNINFIFIRDKSFYTYNTKTRRYKTLYKLHSDEYFDSDSISWGNLKFKSTNEVFINSNLTLSLINKKTRRLNLHKIRDRVNWHKSLKCSINSGRDEYFWNYYFIDKTIVKDGVCIIKYEIFNYDTSQIFQITIMKLDSTKYDQSIHNIYDWRILETQNPNIYICNIVNKRLERTDVVLINIKERRIIFRYRLNDISFQSIYDPSQKVILSMNSDKIYILDVEKQVLKNTIDISDKYNINGKIYLRNNRLVFWRGGPEREKSEKGIVIHSSLIAKPRYFETRSLKELSKPIYIKIPGKIGSYIEFYDVNMQCNKIVFCDTQNPGIFLCNLNNKKIDCLTNPGILRKFLNRLKND